jgi:hypothetical protein
LRAARKVSQSQSPVWVQGVQGVQRVQGVQGVH